VDLVRIEGLTVAYGTRTALAGVDLAIPRGRSVAVIGPNGSGKSTLLGAVAGLVTPSSGRVEVLAPQVALVLQSTEIDATLPLTVREAVRMARYPHRGPFGRFRPDDHAAVEVAMARTEVADLADRQLRALSGGQRQRALVAQGLAQEAPLLLLDEPVTGLDLVSRDVILGIVDEERVAGRSVVMTTHSLEEASRCDLVVLLAGRVVAAGPPGEVIVDEHLEAAFGGRALRLPSGRLLLDDPHHAHHHDDHHDHHH
jgi:ABC-type Mn2+/Zn2+ transport system ATPase subunit